jgi:methyl-accepting chemotaxis protein
MVPSINKTSDLVQEIAAASEEQIEGVARINGATDQLNAVTQQNAAASEQLAATSEEMSGQAETLQQMMAFFTLQAEAAAARRAGPGKPAQRGAARPAPRPVTLNAQSPVDEAQYRSF